MLNHIDLSSCAIIIIKGLVIFLIGGLVLGWFGDCMSSFIN